MDGVDESEQVVARQLLGQKVRDTVTGITGTVTGLAVYLHGTPNAGVEYLDGQGVARTEWIVQSRLELIAT